MNRLRIASLILPLVALLMTTPFGCSNESTENGDSEPGRTALGDTIQLESLQAKLDERNQQFAERAPAEMIALFDSGVDSVRLSGVLETAVNTGDTIPLFSLPDPRGDTVSIANLLDDGPVVITWYRGNW
jgi:hypothetical protein